MSSIVLELQNEVASTNCDIVSVLRKAHLISSKLKLTDFDQWILYELNGYSNKESIPDYRIVKGALKGYDPYRGWIPTMITDPELEKIISEQKLQNSLSELISLCMTSSDKGLIMVLPGGMQQNLNELFDSPLPMQYALHVSTAAAEAVIEKVKNAVLEWTIKLEEEGILGEGMRFNDQEILAAKTIPQTVNNYYGDVKVISGTAENVHIVSGNNNTVCFNYTEAKKIVDEIQHSLISEPLSQDDKDTATELLNEINEKIDAQKKPSIIKSSLVGLKDFLISAGASITAELILAKMHGLF